MLDDARSQIEAILVDETLSMTARSSLLSAIRDEIATLLGRADTYIATFQKAMSVDGDALLAEAALNADIRDELIAEGLATEADCDALGLLSRDDLSALDEEGLLDEALPLIVGRLDRLGDLKDELSEAAWGLAKNFNEFMVLRNRTGQFRKKPGRVMGRASSPVGGQSDHSRFFEPGHDKVVSLDRLVHVKEPQPKSTANARRFMEKAAKGEMPRRAPITVRQKKNGDYQVVDGNATVRAARELGWQDIPVNIVGGDKRDLQSELDRIGALIESAPDKHPQPANDWEGLLDAVGEQMPEFSAIVTKVGEDLGLEEAKFDEVDRRGGVLIAPLKGAKRAAEKVKDELKGDWSSLTDVGRATIVAPDLFEIPDTVQAVKRRAEELGWTVENAKDRLHEKGAHRRASGPTDAGYVDVSMLLRSPEGVSFELLLVPFSIFEAKERKGGHKLYEQWRALDALSAPTPRQQETMDRLTDEQRALYGAAIREARIPVLLEAALAAIGGRLSL